MAPAPAKAADAVPVVVDSDLAPDDLAAITYLMRHPRVRVVGITVPTTGMVTCSGGGLQLLADLFAAIETPSVPVACGVEPRPDDAVAFPEDWCAGVVSDSGLPHVGVPPFAPLRESAADFLARQALAEDHLHVVALAPLTEVAAVRRDHPAAYRRIAGITSMAGIVDGAEPRRRDRASASGTRPPTRPPSTPSWPVRSRSRSSPTTRCRQDPRTGWTRRLSAPSASAP